MASPKYTIAVCNYNMAETLEESLRSILDQIDERFEVLVIDDRSTDGSQEILDKLEEEYEIFRWIRGDNRNLGEARAQANREAKGEYILTQLDTDDLYIEGIIDDFIQIFEQLNSNIDQEFFLSADGLNIGPKSLLKEINYRSMGYGEDRDFWRRLEAEDKLISIKNDQVVESIGYDRGKLEKIKVSILRTVNEFRSGLSLITYYKRMLRKEEKVFEDYIKLPVLPLLYLYSYQAGRYEPPNGYDELESFDEIMHGYLLLEVGEKYSIEIDKSKISDQGKKIFNL